MRNGPPPKFGTAAFREWWAHQLNSMLEDAARKTLLPKQRGPGRPPKLLRADAVLVEEVERVMRKRGRGVSDACRCLAQEFRRYRRTTWVALRQRYYRTKRHR